MSESIVRKVQPFTIGTRLSAPSVAKGQEFPQTYLPGETLDNCVLQHNLNSLYLSRSQQVCARDSCLAPPTVKQAAPVRHVHMAAEDHLDQNTASASAVSRSIKKITISGSKDKSDQKTAAGPAKLSITGSSCGNKNNNNNNVNTGTSDLRLPRIVGVSCENKPNAPFKVLLSKDGSDVFQPAQWQTSVKPKGEESIQISGPEMQKKELQTKHRALHTEGEELAAAKCPSESFSQRNALFNKEALQAEAWIKSKLQDLKDGWSIQYCPQQDWEEALQTLQRDLKDFENTLIQLNQTGEQLVCRLNPTSDLVRKQLFQLRDQWQTLKQTAASQTRVLGGARSLQEFNTKVDKLEAWIKEKEEDPSLVSLLEDNVDKMQLTRKILDLKHDEQLHRNLHEEINNLALKLEKQGKTDGRNISSKRKHINKMWLKAQSQLKNHHKNLQLALEVSSFYQQADNTLESINSMRKSLSSKELDSFDDRDVRDIAGQVLMLDVSVSQLPHLHPALAAGVKQKQTEAKDCWALLQRDLRADRTALSPSGSTFTREDVDLLTPATEPQCNVGPETHGIMGKEVKEEQNRLKGCLSIGDHVSGRQMQSSQSQEQRSVSHAPSAEGGSSGHTATRYQLKEESKAPRAEPRLPSAPQNHPQLQKFTVSADKTLSWLKDNVTMATQVCSIASSGGLEAARECQRALEQEILNNRVRIEVVKREGHGLVRAQHPGSSKIEEFLSQLEVLWEELRRRHQRNAAFLQASEKLGFRIVKVLQALGSLEAWLESVELSMKASALAGDPETMSVAERESFLLEKEVAARGPELGALRQEVDRLRGHSLPHVQDLPARMEEVEKKYHCVLSALSQQNSELRDTLMLTEFLERVELEESQELDGTPFSLGQPLHRDISSAPALLGLQSTCGGEALLEIVGDPVEELREAMEMLNDTVRERGRSRSHDQAIRELLSKHASLAVRVEKSLCSSKELNLDILEEETDLAVQCEPDRCSLEALQERQERLEVDCAVVTEDVKEVENQASRLEDLCPERVHVFRAKIQATLEARNELEKSVTDNKSRLQEFVQLRDFFRSYLAVISWTEDTRSRIFSDAILHFGRDGRRPLAAELDVQIEQKFTEFDELAVTGRTLLDQEHHLAQMVRERMEELRSMLGWISVHWRAQKQMWLHKQSQESSQDNIYSEATACTSFKETPPPELQDLQPPQSEAASVCENPTSPSTERRSSSSVPEQHEDRRSEDGYEIMNRIGPRVESPKANVTVLKGGSSPTTGGAVNLILSFNKTGDSQVQVLDLLPRTEVKVEETSEPLHRVSTYMHVGDTNLAVAPVYESITLPLPKSRPAASASPAFVPSPSSKSSSMPEPQTTNVTFHPVTGISGGSSIFSSLKRMSKKRRRKRDARRHTIQKIMGVDERTLGMRHDCEAIMYDTQTWPLKETRRKKGSGGKQDGVEALAYMKNPLLTDIDSECLGKNSINPYAVSGGQVKGHCRFLSLGSVLSFDLPKDMTHIPSIQDIITIAPPEAKRCDPGPHSQRNALLSSFRQTRLALAVTESSANTSDSQASTTKGVCNADASVQPPSPRRLGENEDQAEQLASPDIKPTTAERDGASQPIYENQASDSVPHNHKCLSVHTLIQDLNGHRYHKCARSQCKQAESPWLHFNQASHMRVNLKSTMSVSIRQDSEDSGSSRLCTDAPCSDHLQPKGVVGRLVSLRMGGIDCSRTRESDALPSSTPQESSDPVRLDHQQFEEEEEELEDIWNQTTSNRQSICSNVMYQHNQEDLMVSDQTDQPLCHSSTTNQSKLYRNLVTASAPNLLVAEFKLPSHLQSSLGWSDEGLLPPLAGGERRSWAAFPNREPANQSSVAVNETASNPVKLPDVGDNPRYIYQYREEEEEEELTGCLKDPSTSLLSVCLGQTCQQNLENMKQQDQTATGGRCFILSGKPELQSLEGTLERKHKLQLGGKKAASRGWSSYHTVLHRHALCFFQDRKDTLRRSTCGLPLNLTGAECSPASDYNKKPNCFRLRLRDGSEYLFSASSRFVMKKWIMKIQASTGPSESVSGVHADQDLLTNTKPSVCSRCEGPTSCCCSSQHDATDTVPRQKAPSFTQTKETLFLLEELRSLPTCLNEQPSSSCSEAGWSSDDRSSLVQMDTHRLSGDILSSPPQSPESRGQRSHSFTSATYQKIKPALCSPGRRGVDEGSNYCVTLVVGDKSNVGAPRRPSPGWQQQDPCSALRGYVSLPRPRNKSVFKKFFGRKEL